MRQAVLEAFNQARDRLRLITRGLEIAVQHECFRVFRRHPAIIPIPAYLTADN